MGWGFEAHVAHPIQTKSGVPSAPPASHPPKVNPLYPDVGFSATKNTGQFFFSYNISKFCISGIPIQYYSIQHDVHEVRMNMSTSKPSIHALILTIFV